MTEHFKPRLREDGTFDPNCLEEAGLRWVKDWLRSRLGGRDPWFPIDGRYEEAPEDLIVSILRDAGVVHPGSVLISRAVLELLDEARALVSKTPESLDSLLNVCGQVRLPQTSSRFAEELAAIASNPDLLEARWGGCARVKAIVQAAILQAPGIGESTSRKSWLSLLAVPRFATLAWLGLGQSFGLRLAHLQDWWRACPEERRQAEVDHLIFMGLKTEGETAVRTSLEISILSWPEDLRAAINQSLKSNGLDELMSFADFEEGLQRLSEEFERMRQDAISVQRTLEEVEASQARFVALLRREAMRRALPR